MMTLEWVKNDDFKLHSNMNPDHGIQWFSCIQIYMGSLLRYELLSTSICQFFPTDNVVLQLLAENTCNHVSQFLTLLCAQSTQYK